MTDREEADAIYAASQAAAQLARETNQAETYERRLREIIQKRFPDPSPEKAIILEKHILKATREYQQRMAKEQAHTVEKIERSYQAQRDQAQQEDRGISR